MLRLDTPALISELDWWDFWTSIFIAAVFVGVLLEVIPDWTPFPRNERWRKALKALGASLLILGLLGELVTHRKTSILVARMNWETAQLMRQVYGAAPNLNPGDEHLPFVNRAVLKRLVLDRLDALERVVRETQQRVDAMSHK